MSPDIVVPMMIFGLPAAIVFIVKYFRFREKQLEAGVGSPKLLEGVRAQYDAKQRELEARIENLESILIAVDGDLEHRLAAKKAGAALPPRSNAGVKAALPPAARSDGSDDGIA